MRHTHNETHALVDIHIACVVTCPARYDVLVVTVPYVLQEARAALAWLRGAAVDDPALEAELRALPPPDVGEHAPLALARDMRECDTCYSVSDWQREPLCMCVCVVGIRQ